MNKAERVFWLGLVVAMLIGAAIGAVILLSSAASQSIPDVIHHTGQPNLGTAQPSIPGVPTG